ncbi:Stk1 family PASTA domain-containing Ser/Thr kinase [Actinomyces sp. B33]|uniref:Stk1 family PASTA domain-containing Ser/Thr kinase n=1 Tax=Actinomyces sp. B33 TaxID=2942131 RepID=UPI0023428106|nr:Stk1 family PASTA domain-containing Ser/Thr kinase [Actinomyces sp. B33]MDC4233968.1 Stk1 family PASTA domain-containing Ser/Thr kinase [Actinomyces sp. B33]
MAEPMARRLAGRYEVRSLIGRGGMAEVHMGFDTRLSRVVAIKMLRTDLAQDSIFQARFRREAQSAASLNHPNIVAVYDTGEESTTAPDGRTVLVPYIVMEYVEGHTVKELISDGTPVPIDEAAGIITGVLSALEYSHAAHLVHRDIKPGNIMLTNDGKVKVMDFGIARALTDSQATMTQTNAVVGTAQYLSPEQARGEQVDARSDLYSTGVVLFELLTGRPPFTGDSAVAVAYQHVQQIAPTPSSITPDVPEALDRVVMKALAKDRNDRYTSASSMLADLMRASRGAAVNAPETSVWASAPAQQTQTMPLSAAAPGYSPTRTSTIAPVAASDEEDDEPRKSRKGLIAGLVVVALLIMAGIGWALINAANEKPQMVAVPDGLVGMTQAEAKTAVEGAGLVWAVADEPVASDTVAEGRIAQTDPAPGAQVEPGSTVTAYLSSGPDTVTLPSDLVGMTPQNAQKAVEALGLTWVLSDEPVASDTVEEGRVAQTNPSPGAKVPAGSQVKGFVSSGTNTITVPDVTGMTQEQARDTLIGKKLQVGSVEVVDDASQPAGRVISTNPAVGSEVSKGDSVTLTIASGKIPIPTGLAGQPEEDVTGQLSGLGLSVVTKTEHSDSVPAGAVIAVSPSEGALVPGGATVTVTVSSGPATPAGNGNPNPGNGGAGGGNAGG